MASKRPAPFCVHRPIPIHLGVQIAPLPAGVYSASNWLNALRTRSFGELEVNPLNRMLVSAIQNVQLASSKHIPVSGRDPIDFSGVRISAADLLTPEYHSADPDTKVILDQLGLISSRQDVEAERNKSLAFSSSVPDIIIPKRKIKDPNSKLKQKAKARYWAPVEDVLLQRAVAVHGERNWHAISAMVPGRDKFQCQQHWRKVLVPGLKKGHFSPEEDRRLIFLVTKESGFVTWGYVARQMPGRNSKQCRERWCNHLDPKVKRGSWLPHEDVIIMNQQKVLGNMWAEIARQLHGRTQNAVKLRWSLLSRRQKRRVAGKAPIGQHSQKRQRAGSSSPYGTFDGPPQGPPNKRQRESESQASERFSSTAAPVSPPPFAMCPHDARSPLQGQALQAQQPQQHGAQLLQETYAHTQQRSQSVPQQQLVGLQVLQERRRILLQRLHQSGAPPAAAAGIGAGHRVKCEPFLAPMTGSSITAAQRQLLVSVAVAQHRQQLNVQQVNTGEEFSSSAGGR